MFTTGQKLYFQRPWMLKKRKIMDYITKSNQTKKKAEPISLQSPVDMKNC